MYPNYDKRDYSSIHLRFGGRLADAPVSKVFLSKNSVRTILHVLNSFLKTIHSILHQIR